MFNQHVCTMLERLWFECFHMGVKQFAKKPDPERCITAAVSEQTAMSFVSP